MSVFGGGGLGVEGGGLTPKWVGEVEFLSLLSSFVVNTPDFGRLPEVDVVSSCWPLAPVAASARAVTRMILFISSRSFGFNK